MKPMKFADFQLLSREEKVRYVDQVIALSKGRFFTAITIKKDGTTRVFNAKSHVVHEDKGGLKFNPKDKGLRSVWDRNVKDWRFLNLQTIFYLKVNGKEYIK